MYFVVTSKQSPYFGPPSPAQAQCQLSWSVGSGIPLAPKYAFVAWQTHVLYMAQEPVAANLHAAHASALLLKAPSLSGSGISPTGSGGGCGCVALSVAQTATLSRSAKTRPRTAAIMELSDTSLMQGL